MILLMRPGIESIVRKNFKKLENRGEGCWVKMFADKTDNLGPIPGAYIGVEGKNRLFQNCSHIPPPCVHTTAIMRVMI